MSIGAKTHRSNGVLGFSPVTRRRPVEWRFEYDPDIEFPQVEIGYGLTAQLVWLTPDLAREWIGRVSKLQRKVKHYQLQSLCEDHLAGRFLLNGEPLIFDADDHLVDGQHRC